MSKLMYEYNTVFRSELTGQFYFVPKAKVIGPTTRVVVGKKYDITEYLQPYLLAKFKMKKIKNDSEG